MLQIVTTDTAEVPAEQVSPPSPLIAIAAALVQRIEQAAGPIVYIAETSRRRSDLAALLRLMTAPERVAEFVALDGMPGDGIAASAEAMGRRMSTLRWLCNPDKRPAIVLATASAVLRRVPPRSIWEDIHLELRVGETIDLEALSQTFRKLAYHFDDLVDEPGEMALRGRVLEIFPPAAPRPCRIEHEDGRIVAIRSFDPATQRSVAESSHLIIDPASERVPAPTNAEAHDAISAQVHLQAHYGTLQTLLDYIPDAELVVEDAADRRATEVFVAIEEAASDAVSADHLAPSEWSALVEGRLTADIRGSSARVPAFAQADDTFAAFADFAAPLLADGYRLVITGPDRAKLRSVAYKAARAAKIAVVTAEDWPSVRAADAGQLISLEAPIAEGFVGHAEKIAVVSLRDLLGQSDAWAPVADHDARMRADEVFQIGDAVIHMDHGIGILEGLETVDAGDEQTEALRLRYAHDETLLVPLAEIGALWRYGSGSSEVKLDRLKGKTWEKRRNALIAGVTSTAESMVARLRARESASAPVLKPDRAAFETFAARFPFELTVDQAQATAAVLADLRSGRPMNRLVCGDVGFGKTEVALRAAAAAVFSGRQVAVVAPTTVLAQQHFLLFQKRFARHGIGVVRLSRLADAAEMADAKAALADGTAEIVVGSHAVLADDVRFADLALVVIDEEQRFGARQKEKLHALAADIHVLTMTATPIPRTLQAGFVGLHDVSIVATPPSRRRPVRTLTGPFDDGQVREALAAEKARGGQSFVVCPRIEDLEPMAERLRELVPALSVTVLHGRMEAAELDDTMLAFSGGEGDVLLATSIIESGLDVAGANTMIIWRADRFGLAQLHQLRGRVGRGTRRGLAILTTDPEEPPTPGAIKRLETLSALNRLGAGFAIAARDLDLRGTGELFGDEQAGHMQLVGVTLYRRTLERALVVASGLTPPDDWRPLLNLGARTGIPIDYIPEADLRIELAILLERTDDAQALDALQSETADRFGPLPASLEESFHIARLRLECRSLGIRRLDAGAKAVAATFAPDLAQQMARQIKAKKAGPLRWSKNRLILESASSQNTNLGSAVNDFLEIIRE
jgi:transcription-repair coupling factor (superfamily II helicase)